MFYGHKNLRNRFGQFGVVCQSRIGSILGAVYAPPRVSVVLVSVSPRLNKNPCGDSVAVSAGSLLSNICGVPV